MLRLLTINHSKDEKFLRQPTIDFDFKRYDLKTINALLKDMRATMRAADGMGLAANQVGFNFRLFIAEPPTVNALKKFYAVFNPQIEKTSSEVTTDTEGCLSIPGLIGAVERFRKITVSGQDKHGQPLTLKVFGQTARIFQHEIDHLNGVLFIDRAQKIFPVSDSPVVRG